MLPLSNSKYFCLSAEVAAEAAAASVGSSAAPCSAQLTEL